MNLSRFFICSEYDGRRRFIGDVTNMLEKGVIEPVWVKQQALKSATEVASMILRIDDVIVATKPKAEGMPSTEEG
jgi:chaperonin GroEL (HSP60 family)